MGSLFENMIRLFLFFFAKAFLTLLDMVYTAIQGLTAVNIAELPEIWKWWSVLCGFLFFFVLIRVFSLLVRMAINDELVQRVDPFNLLVRIASVFMIIAIMPMAFQGFCGMSAGLSSNVGSIISADPDFKPSHIMIEASTSGDLTSMDLDSIDINKKEKGVYVVCQNELDLVFLLISGVSGCVIMAFIGIDMARRVISLGLKILISPYCVASIVTPDDQTFGMWLKLCAADLMTTFVQLLLVMLTFVLSSSNMLSGINPIARVLFFLGCLMGAISAPSGIAQLIGGDVGVGTALQQLQTLQIYGMAGKAAGMIGSAALTGAAAGVYGVGRATGGKGLLHGSGNFYPGGTVGGGSAGGGTEGPSGGSGYSGGQSTSDPSDSREPAQMSREGSFARRVGTSADGSATGRMFNAATRTLYQKSASRLSRPVQYRNARGAYTQRPSRFVTASHLVHGASQAGRGGSRGGRHAV